MNIYGYFLLSSFDFLRLRRRRVFGTIENKKPQFFEKFYPLLLYILTVFCFENIPK